MPFILRKRLNLATVATINAQNVATFAMFNTQNIATLAGGDNRKRSRSAQRRVGLKAQPTAEGQSLGRP